MNATELLQDLYNSEINASLWWNWDGGVEVRLGNGIYNSEKSWEASSNVSTIEEAVEWLKSEAVKLYPESAFAKKYSGVTAITEGDAV